MITGPSKATSKALEPGIPKIPEIDLNKTRGSKPQMAKMTRVPFWINDGNCSTTTGNAKTKGVKPSMAGMVFHFFEVGAPESTDDSIISSIITEVRRGGVLIPGRTLQRRSCKYSSQSFLVPIVIALCLVLAWVLGGHRL